MPLLPRCLCMGVIALVVVGCSSKSPRPATPPAGTSQPGPSAPAPAAPSETAPPAATSTPPGPPAATASGPSNTQATTSNASCPAKPLPKGCPPTAPNVNHPCSSKGVECTYVAGCCPSPVYVCNKKGRFEARFTRC